MARRKPDRPRKPQHPADLTRARQDTFLKAFAEYGSITVAATVAGVTRQSHYLWKSQEGSDYATRFREAKAEVCDSVEQEIRRRAMEGVEKPVFYNGQQCGTIRRYSDQLLMFYARALMPRKYRERHEIRGKGKIKMAHSGQVEVREAMELLRDDPDYIRLARRLATSRNDPKTGKPKPGSDDSPFGRN